MTKFITSLQNGTISTCQLIHVAISFLQHEERAFVLKFSAIEIYNEVVRDLLSAESTSLRLWDDAEVRATNSYIFHFLEKRKSEKKRYPTVPMH